MNIDQIISKVKYQYVITDPFPDHSYYEQMSYNIPMLSKFFRKKVELEKPRQISIHEAYRMGQQSVYDRLEALRGGPRLGMLVSPNQTDSERTAK